MWLFFNPSVVVITSIVPFSGRALNADEADAADDDGERGERGVYVWYPPGADVLCCCLAAAGCMKICSYTCDLTRRLPWREPRVRPVTTGEDDGDEKDEKQIIRLK